MVHEEIDLDSNDITMTDMTANTKDEEHTTPYTQTQHDNYEPSHDTDTEEDLKSIEDVTNNYNQTSNTKKSTSNNNHEPPIAKTLNPPQNKINIVSNERTHRTTAIFSASIFIPPTCKEIRHASRIQQMLAILQCIDKTFTLLPIRNNNLPVLSEPTQIPPDIDDLEEYIFQVREISSHLNLKFQGSYTINPTTFRKELIQHKKDTRHYIRQEKLNYAKTSQIGWFYGIHPFFCNRDQLNVIINEQIRNQFKRWQLENKEDEMWNDEHETHIKVNLYPRKIYAWENDMKLHTQAMSIECLFCVKHQVEKLMTKISVSESFQEKYPLAIMVPFVQALEHSKSRLKAIYEFRTTCFISR